MHGSPEKRLYERYEKTKPNKTGHPSKLVLKQQTEEVAIKNRKGSSWGRWVYIERDREIGR
jgi:hypothetical protein